MILDTNIINNKNCCGDIFGNIKKLEEMSLYFGIVIPKIVLEEIKVHKYRDFSEQKERILDQFDRNYIYEKLGLDKKAVEECFFTVDMKKARL